METPSRQARRASTIARDRSVLEQYGEGLSGEHARRLACRSDESASAAAFMNNAGEISGPSRVLADGKFPLAERRRYDMNELQEEDVEPLAVMGALAIVIGILGAIVLIKGKKKRRP